MQKRGAAETVRTVRTAGTGKVWRPDGRSEVLLGVQKFAG